MDMNWNEGGGTSGEEIEKIFARLESLKEDGDASVSHLDHEARTSEFWNSLTAEQLHFLRTILLAIMNTSTNEGGNLVPYNLGAAEAVLRIKFGLCPRCAKSHDAEKCFQEGVTEAKHHYRTVCDRYGVVPENSLGDNFMVGRVRCKKCPESFESLAARVGASGDTDCPGCQATAAKKSG